MIKKLLLFFFIINTSIAFSQTSKRISIPNPSQQVLKKLQKTGIDLSCGSQYDKHGNLILEISSNEVKNLDLRKIPYTVLIPDLEKHITERGKKFLPIAKERLKKLKQQSKTNKLKAQNKRTKNAKNQNTSKSLSFNSVTVDNILQYEGRNEIDWSANVPQNYQLGSMGGCLTNSEMLAQLDLMRTLYPNLITIKTDASPSSQTTHGNSYTNGGAFNTWSGNTIYYVKISDNPDIDESEPEALYTGMTHSREVSSMMNLMYYMWYLLENYATDSNVKNLVDNRELFFIPVANPDGLLWNEERSPGGGGMQRKNLNPAANTGNNFQRGVDLNRNFNYLWGPTYGGSSNTASNDTYNLSSINKKPID